MIIARSWEWARGKPFEVKRRTFFWLISYAAVFLLISMLTFAVRGPSTPDLKGGIDTITFTHVSDDPNNRAVGVLLVVHILNTGTPSIVDNYQLFVTPAGNDWKPMAAQGLFIPRTLQVPPKTGTQQVVYPVPVVCGKDALYVKTTDQPLANGSQVRGILWFRLNGFGDQDVLNPAGTKFDLKFTDVTGKQYVASFTWPAFPMAVGGYIGGMNIPKSDNPEEACN